MLEENVKFDELMAWSMHLYLADPRKESETLLIHIADAN
jgi:hypothetical protein